MQPVPETHPHDFPWISRVIQAPDYHVNWRPHLSFWAHHSFASGVVCSHCGCVYHLVKATRWFYICLWVLPTPATSAVLKTEYS